MSDQPTTPDEDETQDTGAPQGDSEHLEAGPGPGHSESAGDDYRDSQIGGDKDALHEAFESLKDEPSVADVDPDEAARNAEEDTADRGDTDPGTTDPGDSTGDAG